MSKKKIGFVFFLTITVILMASIVMSVSLKKETPRAYPQYFVNALAEQKPVFVFFFANWCSHCVNFMPVYDELEKYYAGSYNFIKVNVDNIQNHSLTQEFYITGIPTIYVIVPKENKKYLIDYGTFHNIDSLKEELNKYIKGN